MPPRRRPEDYGSEVPSAKATIVWKDDPKSAKKLSRTLEFGIEIPGTDATAARVAGSDAVLFVPTSLASAVKKGADEFKSKEVFVLFGFGRRAAGGGPRAGPTVPREEGRDLVDPPASLRPRRERPGREAHRALTALRVLDFVPLRRGRTWLPWGSPRLSSTWSWPTRRGPARPSISARPGRMETRSMPRREGQVFTVASTIVGGPLAGSRGVPGATPCPLRPRLGLAGGRRVRAIRVFRFARREGGWSLAGRALTAPSVDDLLSALLDVKSKSFLDEATGKALASREPAATVTMKLSSGAEPLPGPFASIRREPRSQATVSGRPGAFLIAGDPVSALEAAFQKAATPPHADVLRLRRRSSAASRRVQGPRCQGSKVARTLDSGP